MPPSANSGQGRPLPLDADFTQLNKQAKDLLKAHHAGDAGACETLRLVPRLSEMTNEEILAEKVSLQEAQHALAKDYGFTTWAELKGMFETPGVDKAAARRDAKRAKLMAGVTIRPMTRDDIPALRRFDDELTPTLDEVNAQAPAGGGFTVAGGPWTDDEELLWHFNKYQRQGGVILLAEDAGRVVGFADCWPTDEPEPFGPSLDVECADYFREYYLAGLEIRLLQEAEKVARQMGLPALDFRCDGEFVSLRSFGLRLFYDYDNVACRCRPVTGPRPTQRVVTSQTVDIAGLIKANHWSPTDFSHRDEDEPTHFVELTWPERRAIVELWRHRPGLENAPVPPNVPNKSELYVQPEALTSSAQMSEILAECAAVAGELGAEEVELPCPGDVELDGKVVDVISRQFAFAWMRKRL